ncbi:unnamed protein product [Paramecium pentaurelia]|uniref:Uncharacterized protein n=1 Tax=Paramecium pentaurelia TaxID=43138 RepID=A0A8S1VAQ7_9CILI|nr:unnamed protein product [Paramecium pentaurelia]
MKIKIYPDHGSVCFGSGKKSWAFLCTKLALIYAKKKIQMLNHKNYKKNFGVIIISLLCPNVGGRKAMMIQENNYKVLLPHSQSNQSVNWLIQSQKEIEKKMFYILGLELTQEEQKLSGKFLLKAVMSKWINTADTLIEMIICHLPSSTEAKKFRTSFFQIILKKLKCYHQIKFEIIICIVDFVQNFITIFLTKFQYKSIFCFWQSFSDSISTRQLIRIIVQIISTGRQKIYLKSPFKNSTDDVQQS